MKFYILLISLLVVFPVYADTSEGNDIQYRWNQLVFESDLQINLHHFLYQLARDDKYFETTLEDTRLSSVDKYSLSSTVDIYKSKMDNRHILFDRGEIPQITIKVLAHDVIKGETSIGKALKSFQPIYERLYWEEHDKRNKEWIEELVPRLDRFGKQIKTKLEQIFDGSLFSQKSHLISVVYKPGTRQGAYTSSRSLQSVINSTDEYYLNWYALELTFHEISHAISVNRQSKLYKSIESEFNSNGLESEIAIWHPILFYTVGEVVKKAISNHNPKYIPYADINNIFTGSWDYKKILIEHWQPYIEGQVTMAIAIENIAKELQKGAKQPNKKINKDT
jgi:hypothetical protein